MTTKPTAVDLVRGGVFASLDEAVRFLDERDELRAKVEQWRAVWAKWRPGIENTRDFYEKDGNEPRAKAYAAILRDFDAATSQ